MQKAKDALALLKRDHEEVAAMFKRAEKDEEAQEGIFAEINAALTVHATIEEEIFYPAVQKAKAEKVKDEVLEALAEHKQIKALLAELSGMSGDDESFAPKLKVLKEDVEHHVEEEQTEMFPDAKKYLGEKRLVELGTELDQRKRRLMSEMDMDMNADEHENENGKSANGNGDSNRSSSKSKKSGSKSGSSHKPA
jgi:hemerythrin superfamily protein